MRWVTHALVTLGLVLGLLATVGGAASADPQTPAPPGAPAAGSPAAPGEPGAPAAEEPVMVGFPGTHAAHDQFGYGFPEAPDCDESPAGTGGCVADDRGFFQGQCTSWVAHRLSQRNAISFSNWYAGLHWGDAADWNKAAKAIGHKPDRTPAVGAVAWFRRGHVAYVEAVNTDGSIVISEMNFDGHNGFRLVTVYPGYGWPDRFLHLADVIPSDTTPPSAPGQPTAVAHRDRVGLSWGASTDAFGVEGYRVLRDGVPLGSTTGTTWWDRRVTAGQTYRYSVVALDDAGNVSAPAEVRVVPESEAADRAWVRTSAGPALCGRAGTDRAPRVGCTVLTDRGWRRVAVRLTPGRAGWGSEETRRFVAGVDGSVSYCRSVGVGRHAALACTRLDPGTLAWGYERISAKLPRLTGSGADRAWLPTTAGPARCGLSGTERAQRLTCSVLTDAGWRVSRLPRETRWGQAESRTFLADRDGDVTFCRTVGTRVPRLTCTPFHADTQSWGYDRVSRSVRADRAANAQWLSTSAGPAWCTGSGSGRPGCRLLTDTGWRAAMVAHARTAGDPLSRAFVAGADGSVSWCRTLGNPTGTFRAACSRLDPERLNWGPDRRSGLVRSGQLDNRTWVATAVGPALCGRSGTAGRQQVGCEVLVERRWRTTSAPPRVGWGLAGVRAFVPTGDGVSWCRADRPTRLSCSRLAAGSLRWSADRTSFRTPPLPTYADVL